MPDHLPTHPGNKSVIYDYNKADFSAMGMYLNGSLLIGLLYADCTSALELWSAFCVVLQDVVDKFVPKITVTAYSTSRYPIKIRKMLTRKAVLWGA